MEIDIINYTSAQYAALTVDQILEVRAAQEKKNKLQKKLSQSLHEIEKRYIENGTYHSSSYNHAVANVKAEYLKEVEKTRDALLFFLQYASRPSQTVSYPLDYSLTYLEREAVVREYYLTTYTSATDRFEAFKADKVALQYLGERYASLYDYFLTLKNKETA
ncbi:MAG: hypothetical protein IJY05_00695 [Clostridia bacterium]|nr:hypothetical protein [Clostridia bacterium]